MNEQLNTRKDLVLLETSITEFNENFCIPAIPKLAFNLTRACILGTHHFGKEQHEAFKRREELHRDFCWRYYS